MDNKQLFGDCRDCKFYYITWDRNFPYGCRAMGFKGKQQPSYMVYKSSGIKCQLFQKKIRAENDKKGSDSLP